MSTGFKIEARADHIHVELASSYGSSAQDTEKLMAAIADYCARHDCRRVLIEGSGSRGGIKALDAFALGSLMGTVLPGASLAFCLHGYSPDEFLLDVTHNRGVRLKFFDDGERAVRWLTQKAH